jgi:hypothetical protein
MCGGAPRPDPNTPSTHTSLQMLLNWLAAMYVAVYAYLHLNKSLRQSFAVKRREMVRERNSIIFYSVYWALTGLMYVLSVNHRNTGYSFPANLDTARVFTALFMSKSVVSLLVRLPAPWGWVPCRAVPGVGVGVGGSWGLPARSPWPSPPPPTHTHTCAHAPRAHCLRASSLLLPLLRFLLLLLHLLLLPPRLFLPPSPAAGPHTRADSCRSRTCSLGTSTLRRWVRSWTARRWTRTRCC